MGNRGMYEAQPSQYAPPKPTPPSSTSSSGAAYATTIYNKDASQPPLRNPVDQPPPAKKAKESEDDNLDEFDDLTVDELRSLLDNFKNLSKGEQMDLIRYMRKLEQNDPEKVKLLKQSVKPGGQSKTTNPSASQSKPQASSAPREVKNEPSRERPISQASSNSSGTQGYRGMMSGPPPPPPAPPEENNWGQPPPPNNAGPPPDNWGGGPMGGPPMGGSNNGGPWGSQPPGRWNNTGPFGGYGQQDGYYGPDGGHGGFY